jgi:hypothetical protein
LIVGRPSVRVKDSLNELGKEENENKDQVCITLDLWQTCVFVERNILTSCYKNMNALKCFETGLKLAYTLVPFSSEGKNGLGKPHSFRYQIRDARTTRYGPSQYGWYFFIELESVARVCVCVCDARNM